MFKKSGFSSCYPVLKAFFQWIILVLAKGGRDSIGPPRRQYIPGIYAEYTANRVTIYPSIFRGVMVSEPSSFFRGHSDLLVYQRVY